MAKKPTGGLLKSEKKKIIGEIGKKTYQGAKNQKSLQTESGVECPPTINRSENNEMCAGCPESPKAPRADRANRKRGGGLKY